MVTSIQPNSMQSLAPSSAPVDLRFIQKAVQISFQTCRGGDVCWIRFDNEEEADAFIQAHNKQFDNLRCERSNVKTTVQIYDQWGEIKDEAIVKTLEDTFGKSIIKKIPTIFL